MSSQKEPQKVDLYDFLYKDTARLNSYYSQLFRGVIQSVQHNNDGCSISETTNTSRVGATSNYWDRSGKMSESNRIGNSTTLNPHDYPIATIVDYLFDNNYIHFDFENAPNHSLIKLEGSINIVDRFYTANILDEMEELINKGEGTEYGINETSKRGIRNFKRFDFDNTFIFTTDTLEVGGFISNEYLCDKISTISLSLGGFDTQDLNMIGIKHIPKDTLSGENLKHIEHQKNFNSALKGLLFGNDMKYMVTPIVIFKRLK